MLAMDQVTRTEFIASLYQEITNLQHEFDEALYSALAFHNRGDEKQASIELDKLDFVDWQLTNIRTYLESNYKQVVSLH